MAARPGSGARKRGKVPANDMFAKLSQIHAASSDINEAILRSRDPDELLQNACDIIVRHCAFDAVSIRLLSEDGALLRLRATAGPLSEWVRQHSVDISTAGVEGQGLAVQAFASGRPFVTNDRVTDERFARRGGTAAEAGVRSSAGLPLVRSGKSIGALVVASRRPGMFDEAIVALLSHVANNVSFALEKFDQERALRDSEARFRGLVELSSDVYWEQDADFRFVRAARSSDDTQLSPAAVKGKTRWEQPQSAPLQGSWDDHRAVLAARKPYRNFEYRYRTESGDFRYVSANGEPFYDAAGRFAGYRGTARNITAAKRDEQTLRRFRAALDQSSDMVLLSDVDTARIVDFNDALSQTLGFRRDELIGRTLDVLLAHRSLDDVKSQRRGTLLRTPGQRDQMRSAWRRKDGSVVEVEVLRQCIAAPEGDIVVGIARDLTNRLAGERRMHEHSRHQECIAHFGREALGAKELGALFGEAAEAARTGLGVSAVFLCEIDRDQDTLVELSGAKVASAGRRLAWPVVLGPRAADRLAALDAAATGNDAANPLLPAAWTAAYPSVLVQPVLHAGEAPMFFVCLSDEPDRFSRDEVSFLEAIASLLSTAVQRHASENRLAYMAQYDVLTGLANRSVVRDRLAQGLARARAKSPGGTVVERRGPGGTRAPRTDGAIGVLFVDLDRFKLVNDTLGHAAGDQLLADASRRLRDCVRQGDIVGRISGDEFAIVLNDLTNADDAGIVARKVLQVLASPFRLGDDEAFVSASVGIAISPDDSDDAETLLKQADTAMYRAKESGRNGFCFYTAEMNERSQHRLQLASELRRAVERGEFRLYYQPKVSLADGRVCGLEALMRWQHPERGLVMPDEFIPVLEETGLIVAAGEWALGEACSQIARWRDDDFAVVPVAVNVSARQFRDPHLETRVRDCAAAAGIEVTQIELEITESHLIENPAAARHALEALRAAGIRISVDDFGTGYSSLSYLTQFPLTALKIDRSFVRHATTRSESASIVRAIVTMAQSLHFITIAEGVEDERQAKFLRELGCDQAQGFLFSRALPPAGVERLLETRRSAV